jgi:hypothetical protein
LPLSGFRQPKALFPRSIHCGVLQFGIQSSRKSIIGG